MSQIKVGIESAYKQLQGTERSDLPIFLTREEDAATTHSGVEPLTTRRLSLSEATLSLPPESSLGAADPRVLRLRETEIILLASATSSQDSEFEGNGELLDDIADTRRALQSQVREGERFNLGNVHRGS